MSKFHQCLTELSARNMAWYYSLILFVFFFFFFFFVVVVFFVYSFKYLVLQWLCVGVTFLLCRCIDLFGASVTVYWSRLSSVPLH